MRALVLVALLAAGLLRQPQEAPPTDWIDADTGHRVVRLTGDAGGSTLYFHDNAFSPQGDRLIVNTPDGIAMIDVAKIGTAEARVAVIAPRARGGYFARRTREIYFSDNARGAIVALNVDTRVSRDVPHARGLINADETLSVVKNATRRIRTALTRRRLPARSSRSSSGCFPARRWRTSRPISSSR
jgi:oligogalacturonide lyase